MASGFKTAENVLGLRLRLRGALRLRTPGDSTGSVPLQSGYVMQDQNGPPLPVRWRVADPHCGQGGPWGILMDSDVPRYCAIS